MEIRVKFELNIPCVQIRYGRNITVQVGRNDRQAVGNNRCSGRWVQGEGEEGKAEDPTRYLFLLHMSVSHLGGLSHALCKQILFLGGWSFPFEIGRVPLICE